MSNNINKKRCDWVDLKDSLYVEYHDNEWGKPVRNDATQFEFLVLESFQAGLSWRTILRKREYFRKAFDQFDYQKIALYDENKVQELMQNKDIVRNQLKIRSAINNAQKFQEVQREFGSFSDYIWSFTSNQIIKGHWKNIAEVPARSQLSDKISKDLKTRGFKFLGSTIVYAHLQATGILDDHITSCFCYKKD